MSFLSLLTKTPTAHQSRWGWHPVSYDDFIVLRRLHKRYWKAVHNAYRWARWTAKAERNRRGPEPTLDSAFYDRAEAWAGLERYRRWGGEHCHFHGSCVPRTPIAKMIVEDYHAARTPNPTPNDVGSVDMSLYRSIL